MSRPELTGHASLFYNEREARKYNSSSRMVNVQREITLRSIELLLLPPDKTSYILDIGCGSGLSGKVLEEEGHVWVGCDVSRDMLQVARERIDDSFDDVYNMNSDDRDGNEDEHDKQLSTGDLLHHVSISLYLLKFCSILFFSESSSLNANRTWGLAFRFDLPRLTLAFLFLHFNGYATVTLLPRIQGGDSYDFSHNYMRC